MDDNLRESFKSIKDSLQKADLRKKTIGAGWIVDDGLPGHVFEYYWEHVPQKKGHVTVEVYPPQILVDKAKGAQ